MSIATMIQTDEVTRAALKQSATDLVTWCHKLSYVSGWWTQTTPDGAAIDLTEVIKNGSRFAQALTAEKLMLIVSEIGEAMEGHRKSLPDDKLPQHAMLTVELADAVIRICDLAGALNLPLGQALVEKLAFNQQRPDHKPEHRARPGGKAY